jgi:hypothetical protein
VGRFGRLSREQLGLLESFLRSRGNLREMERELGISYPTVRNRVEALVRALGLGDTDAATDIADGGPGAAGPVGDGSRQAADERRRILEQLARREITADVAAAMLRSPAGVERADA